MKSPKNSGRAPSMQWYPADWRKDTAVQMLEFHDRGVWFELINIMHESSERGVLVINGQPMPEEAMARLLGLDNQTFNQTLSKLLSYGVAKRREADGAIYCKRMVEDERLSQSRREAGKLGGNPNLLNQNPTTPVNQNPTPSSSTSSSSSNINAGEDLALVPEIESKPKNPIPESIRVALHGIYPRKPETKWSDKEVATWRRLKLSESQALQDIALFTKARSAGWTYHRRDIETLLNNWQQETERANEHLRTTPAPASQKYPGLYVKKGQC